MTAPHISYIYPNPQCPSGWGIYVFDPAEFEGKYLDQVIQSAMRYPMPNEVGVRHESGEIVWGENLSEAQARLMLGALLDSLSAK